MNATTANRPATIAVLTMGLLLASPATAVKWECGERSNLPQEGKNYCAAGDFRHTEVKLRKVLEALIETHALRSDEVNALKIEQSEFESVRDHQCTADNKRNEDKPFHPMVMAQCKTRLNNVRIAELVAELENKKPVNQ